MRQPKIAFVGNSALTMMNFRKGLMSALVNAGYDVTMIAPQDGELTPIEGTGIHFIPITVDCKGTNPKNDYNLYRELKNIYRDRHFDFVFHYTIKPVIYGSMAAGVCGIRHISVVTGLGYTFIKRNWLFRVSCMLHKLALRKAEAVWFLNREDCDVFVSLRLVSRAKAHVIPGEGVNTEFFRSTRPMPEQASFIYIGRMLRYKGVELFVRAAEVLRKEYPAARWKLLGPFAPDDPSCIDAQEVENWVHRGLVEYMGVAKDIRPYLEQVSCCVLPSYFREGVPRSLMEAASMERVIITTNSVGCREVVRDGVNGIMCNPNDLDSLIAAMRQILEMPVEKIVAMGKAGRELVLATFDERIIVNEYLQVLSSLQRQ